MKFFNLFLILNIVICSAGVCGSAVAFESSPYETKESCHEMEHNNSDTADSLIFQEFDVKQSTYSFCCNSLITNSAYSYDIKIYFQDLPQSKIQDVKITKKYLFDYYPSKQGHDPPDLQKLNSTFLI